MSGLLDLSKLKTVITDELKALNDPSRKKKKVPRRTSGQVPTPRKAVAQTKPVVHTSKPQPPQAEKPVVIEKPQPITETEPPIPETKAEEVVSPVEEKSVPTVDHFQAEPLVGKFMQVRLDKSFSARLALAEEELRGYYVRVKQTFFSYPGVKSHVSWRGELFRLGTQKLGVLQIRGKMLYLYLALDPETELDSKYKGEATGGVKAFDGMPYCYIINGDRKCLWATELIAMVCESKGLKIGETPAKDFLADYPVDTEENLVDRMLIKEVVYLLQEPPKGWAHAKVVGDTISTEGIETYRTNVVYRRYAFLSLATLEKEFKAGDKVDLVTLKQRGLIPQDADSWRVTGSDGLTKPLHIETNYCTLKAASVIVENGGDLKIYKSCSNF